MSAPKILVVIAMLAAGLHLYATSGPSPHDPRNNSGADAIVMLSAQWCGYCKALRSDLDKMGVAYTELDIDVDEGGMAAFRAVNARGVPVLVVGQEVVYGYDPGRSRALIEAAGHPLASR